VCARGAAGVAVGDQRIVALPDTTHEFCVSTEPVCVPGSVRGDTERSKRVLGSSRQRWCCNKKNGLGCCGYNKDMSNGQNETCTLRKSGLDQSSHKCPVEVPKL
jgi:hypothetical protein